MAIKPRSDAIAFIQIIPGQFQVISLLNSLWTIQSWEQISRRRAKKGILRTPSASKITIPTATLPFKRCLQTVPIK
jgi:hypothetical protein